MNAAGQVAHFASKTAPTGWLKCNGATVSRTTYARLFAAIVPKVSTVSISVTSPAFITWSDHGLSAGDTVYFSTTGALPAGLTALSTPYYVLAGGITASTFRISSVANGAALNTSGSQSGFHTAHNAPFGIGDGVATFSLPDLRGIFVRSWSDDSATHDAGRAFGTYQSDMLASHSHSISYDEPNFSDGGTYRRILGLQQKASFANTNATGGTETRPRNIALLACIKY